MKAEARSAPPGALAMHQTFVRPLEAEEVGIEPQLPSPPRLEWLELAKYWKSGRVEPIWFLADPVRSDLALIDPASRRDSTELRWPLVARPAFGGMRPSAVRWYRMPAPGWFAEEGWSLTPETAGMSRLMGRGPHLGPIVAMVRRRAGAARVLIGGRNLAGPNDPAARFTMAIDGAPFQQWDAAPGFFLQVFEIPAGRLTGEGPLARLDRAINRRVGNRADPDGHRTIRPAGRSRVDVGVRRRLAGGRVLARAWACGAGRAIERRCASSVRRSAVRITLSIESPLRYFDEAPLVRATAGEPGIGGHDHLGHRGTGPSTCPPTPWPHRAASSRLKPIARLSRPKRGGGADQRRLGLRVFSITSRLNR